MVAGRSGTQKSGFALWWVKEMNLPTLYLAADMSKFQVSARLASSMLGISVEEVEAWEKLGGERSEEIADALSPLNILFSFGEITWEKVDNELSAWVEHSDEYPKVIVIDNLMDVEDAQADYQAQMEAMQEIKALSQTTGATVIVLHHASDKSWDARTDPWAPPSRDQVKGGLSEKPELSLSVGFNPMSGEFRVAAIKQRMGRSDPTASTSALIKCVPEYTRFEKYVPPNNYPTPTGFTVLGGERI